MHRDISVYDTSDEPVDGESVYQVNILVGTKVLHEKLWNICKDVYYKYKVNRSSVDFMFLKRYQKTSKELQIVKLKYETNSLKGIRIFL
jgi:hypothetical protein